MMSNLLDTDNDVVAIAAVKSNKANINKKPSQKHTANKLVPKKHQATDPEPTVTNSSLDSIDTTKIAQIVSAVTTLSQARSLILNIDEEVLDLNAIVKNLDNAIDHLTLMQTRLQCQDPAVNNSMEAISEEDSVLDSTDQLSSIDKASTAPYSIKYAPAVKPVTGIINLCCISLNWKDKKGPALANINSMGNAVANTYKNLSNGLMKFNVASKVIDVDYTHNPRNLYAAEAQAKAKANAARKQGKYDMFAIVHSGVRNYSNAGMDTAHLTNTLIRTALHEVGHLRPFKLEHAGRIDQKTGALDPYGDGSSFMGKFSSTQLTGPQMYFLGWLPQNKVAQYDIGTPAIEYKMEPLFAKPNNGALKGVLIPKEGRNLFLSMFTKDNKNLLALHLSQRGGSQRVAVFGQKADYNGLRFEKIAQNGSVANIRITSIPPKK